MFKTTTQALGSVKAGTKHQITFPYEDIETIHAINLGCGCTSAYNDPNIQSVVVNYTAQQVPQHLLNLSQYHYTAKKTLYVVYNPKGEQQAISTTLSFEVTVNN